MLAHEQAPNPYITPQLCFRFHYFAIRKLHFMLRAPGRWSVFRAGSARSTCCSMP